MNSHDQQPTSARSSLSYFTPTRYTPGSRLEEYANKYAATFVFERDAGVLQVRLSTDGGPGGRSGWFEVWNQAWLEIGNDPENEVIIITGTGDRWIELLDSIAPDGPDETEETSQARHQQYTPSATYDAYFRALKNTENIVFGINVPTIAAINGPAPIHSEFALLCDITICTDDTVFRDPHYAWGFPPGDGLGMVLQELLGPKRAAYYLYTGEHIPAQAALELGLVNEVLPRERLIPRAMEIARKIQEMPTLGRLMTKQIIRRRYQQLHVNDAGFHLAHEILGLVSDFPTGAALSSEQRRRAADSWDAATGRTTDTGFASG